MPLCKWIHTNELIQMKMNSPAKNDHCNRNGYNCGWVCAAEQSVAVVKLGDFLGKCRRLGPPLTGLLGKCAHLLRSIVHFVQFLIISWLFGLEPSKSKQTIR